MRFLLTLLFVAVVAWFWYDNAGLLAQQVPLALRLPFVELRPLPPEGPRIDVLLIIVFLSGFLLAYGFGLANRIKSMLKIRQLNRQLQKVSTAAQQPSRPIVNGDAEPYSKT